MSITTGHKLPDVALIKITEDGRETVHTGAYFAGRKVVLFSLPGAFTPTCSAKHLPGYVEHAAAIRAHGVDEIICTAVNDPFVMAAWGKAQGAAGVTLLADGNAAFVTALGLTFDGSGVGLGTRGQRFAMVMNDGVVEQLFIEAPGEFKVSAAEHVLAHL